VTFYIQSKNTEAAYNLALEQYVFDILAGKHDYFMLWRNNNSVIVGKNQNTIAEIDSSFVKTRNISVVRRLSGGGAVYHDLGNLNFTFIRGVCSDKKTDFSFFCALIKDALISLGVPAVVSGRNDITAEGKKISGNALYIRQGRVMHHGTLLYDCDLDMLNRALNVNDDKLESKGIKSVKSRVTNIRRFMKNDMPIEGFQAALKNYFFNILDMEEYHLSDADNGKIEKLKEEIYSKWSWNYGSSPPFNVRKKRRIEGCGNIEILLDIEKEGLINNITFYGDFFGNEETCVLAQILKGRCFEFNELAGVLKEIDLSRFFSNISAEAFLTLLFE